MSIAYPEQTALANASLLPAKRSDVQATVYECLVVSDSEALQQSFRFAAGENGWEPCVCRTADEAAAAVRRIRFHLAMVDLVNQAKGTTAEVKQLTEQLARESGMLLMVCGHEEDPLEEIWARQLGSWLYLAGVDETCDLSLLCREARQVTEKLHPEPSGPAALT